MLKLHLESSNSCWNTLMLTCVSRGLLLTFTKALTTTARPEKWTTFLPFAELANLRSFLLSSVDDDPRCAITAAHPFTLYGHCYVLPSMGRRGLGLYLDDRAHPEAYVLLRHEDIPCLVKFLDQCSTKLRYPAQRTDMTAPRFGLSD